jgi:hypothetical protein
LELAVGDVLQLGDHALTVIDIDGLEVSFRIDASHSNETNLDLPLDQSPPRK